MRAAIWILGLATLHFMGSRWLFLAAVGIDFRRWNAGDPLSMSETVLTRVMEVLHFPLSLLLPLIPAGWFPGCWGDSLFCLNSLLWGATIYGGAVVWMRVRASRRDV